MAAKKGLHPAIACALMVVMLCCALCLGANKAWVNQRDGVNESVAGLRAALSARAETARNVLTVASRHLSFEDSLLVRLAEDASLLENGDAAYSAQADASERFATDAKAVLNALSALDSVKNDGRDAMYVTQMLPQAVEQCAHSAAQDAYNAAAAAYNAKLNNSFSGWLARLTGVSYLPAFASAEL